MRVLVIEDDEGIASGLRAHLRQHGCVVDVVPTAAGGWAALRGEPFDVVLLDLGLPDADGLTVLEALAPRGMVPRRTIALTGDGDDATVARCQAAGCHEVLLKPVSPGTLLKKVREAVG